MQRRISAYKNFLLKIMIFSCVIASIGFIPPYSTHAAVPLIHDIFATSRTDNTFEKIYVSYEVYVWSNGKVEVYVTYCYYDPVPEKAVFYYLRVQTIVTGTVTYGDDINIPEHAPNVYQTGYAYNVNPDVEHWINDGYPMFIGIQMKIMSWDYLCRYAVLRMVVFHSGWGLLSSSFVDIVDKPIMPDPWPM